MRHYPFDRPRRPPLDHQLEAKFSCPTCGAKPGEWCKPLNSGDSIGKYSITPNAHRKRRVKMWQDQKRRFK